MAEDGGNGSSKKLRKIKVDRKKKSEVRDLLVCSVPTCGIEFKFKSMLKVH